MSDNKGKLPDISKDFKLVLLEGIKTNTYGVFLEAIMRNATFVVLTIHHGVIKLR